MKRCDNQSTSMGCLMVVRRRYCKLLPSPRFGRKSEVGLRELLSEVEVDPGNIPSDAWCPPSNHPLPRVADFPFEGLPTGLAISGILLNVALLKADRVIENYLKRSSGERRGAIIRFVDDMYVLSRSSVGLLCLIEAVHGALSGMGATSLAIPNEVSNICINFGKIKPNAVQKVIHNYLVEREWEECGKCGQPLPLFSQPQVTDNVSHWWDEVSINDQFRNVREAFERAAIEQGDVGPFVTSLVERLSDMGTDTLRQRFGKGAQDYLARLHELARFDIEDEQVRAGHSPCFFR